MTVGIAQTEPLPAGPSLTDEQVIARVRAGELALFEIILRRYNQRLFRIARAVLRNDSDAEDAVQESWVSAYTHLHQFAGEARFSTWLSRIAIHEALGRRRRRAHRAEVDLDAEEGDMKRLPSADSSPEEESARREMTAILERAVDGLPEIYRLVFTLREVQQLSTAETADALELSEEAVKVRLHRARAALREQLFQRVGTLAPEAFGFLGARCDRIVAAVMARLASP